jgi:hypothetical protein
VNLLGFDLDQQAYSAEFPNNASVYLYLTPLLFAGSYISCAKHSYSVPLASLVVDRPRIWASGITVLKQQYGSVSS